MAKDTLEAKGEPVAWMVYTQEGQSAFVTDNPSVIHLSQRALPLYTTSQRAWVGLTEEEKHSAAWSNGEFGDGVLWAEKLLKERNT